MNGVSQNGVITYEITHEQSGTRIRTTPPVDNGGLGDCFSPTDLVVAAYGSCMATTIGLFAQRSGINVEALAFRLQKIMSSQPPRKINEIKGIVEITSNCDADQFRALTTAAKACPVAKSLASDVIISVEIIRRA